MAVAPHYKALISNKLEEMWKEAVVA